MGSGQRKGISDGQRLRGATPRDRSGPVSRSCVGKPGVTGAAFRGPTVGKGGMPAPPAPFHAQGFPMSHSLCCLLLTVIMSATVKALRSPTEVELLMSLYPATVRLT